MSQKKLDLLAVVLLVLVAVFYIAIGVVVTWKTKDVTELFKFLGVSCLVIMETYIYYELHVGGGEK